MSIMSVVLEEVSSDCFEITRPESELESDRLRS